jgi:hypothetical protein
MFRVRTSWINAASQIGAFTNLEFAKELATQRRTEGFKVFDQNGHIVFDPNPNIASTEPTIPPQITTESPTLSSADINRYIVLVLDVSGSISGEPFRAMKNAAKAFCEYILNIDDRNYIAIVTYSNTARVLLESTNDYNLLNNAIDMMSSGGASNIYDGLTTAEMLLDNILSEYAAKKIFLIADGLPNRGPRSEFGPYFTGDYRNYRYANAVFNKAEELKSKYDLLTLGFFHNVRAHELDFAQRFINEDLPSDRFKGRLEVVENSDELTERFITAAVILSEVP